MTIEPAMIFRLFISAISHRSAGRADNAVGVWYALLAEWQREALQRP